VLQTVEKELYIETFYFYFSKETSRASTDFSLASFGFLFLENSTYRPGIRIRPKIVPINIPPAAAVPMERLPNAPAPDATQSGIKPAINAKEVIRIGRSLAIEPSMAASITEYPAFRLRMANSMIRIAFLPNNPMSMISATWAYTLFCRPNKYRAAKDPKTPAGRKRITGSGKTKLSYWAANSRYTKSRQTMKIKTAWLPVCTSCRVIPYQSYPYPMGSFSCASLWIAAMASPVL